MINVLVLTRYERLGASSRVRFLQFLPALEREGFTFDVRPLLSNAYVSALYGGTPVSRASIAMAYLRRLAAMRKRMRYDVVWLEKEALPWLPAWVEIARLEGIPYVADYDDAWFYRYENHWLRPLLGHKLDKVMQVARTVVAGNDFLARRARQAGARAVEIVPTAIDLDRYRDLPVRAPGGPMNVGWVGHPHTVHYLPIVADALRGVEGVNLQVVGAPVPEAFTGMRAEAFSWTEESEVTRIADFDAGIMPLPDTPWERGKCAYKLLQVMAAGKPVIASPVGANRQVVQHGINGFLAETPEEWSEALRKLAASPDLRARMGVEARKTAEQGYSTAVVVPRLAAILREAAENG
jgi:glycosyltransferase involved in cell wall biosynthesis